MPEAEISVDPAGMQAVLRLPAGTCLPASTTLDRMMKAGVVAGVVESALREAEVAVDHDRDLVVAVGIPAVQPVDGRIDLLVDFAIRLAEDVDHHIDFREQGRFREVEPGAVLARAQPATPGRAGRTVLGRDLPVSEPRSVDLTTLAGEGTVIRGDALLTERLGLVVRRRDGHFDIMPVVEVSGDLDMHWGNLTTRLPVAINGDVIAGFSLKSDSDVTVKGVIEDARVSVKGNLTCGGILPGTHRVKAHGNLIVTHAAGRELKCGHLIVNKDLRGCTVSATNDVTAKLVVSSTVKCGGSLVCDELGNASGMGGVVQVGVNPLAVALWRLAAREHDAIAGEVGEAKARCRKLAMQLKREVREQAKPILADQLRKALARFEDRLHRLGECEAILANAGLRIGNNPDATVTVNQAVHPGAEIRVGTDAVYVVAKPMGRTVFRLKEGKVGWE